MTRPATAQHALTPQFRPTRASDDAAFRELLLSVYGDTYSYRELYVAGGYARFLQSGKGNCHAELDSNGRIVGHVAFLRKDPRGDYVEQGMAFRSPRLASGASREQLEGAYKAAIATVRAPFVHQNVTTYHGLAQRFAKQHIGAKAAGFIFDYAAGETLRAHDHSHEPMCALVMTAALQTVKHQTVILPENAFGRWLARVYDRLALPRTIVWELAARAGEEEITKETFELNPSLGLRRRALVRDPEPKTGPLGLVKGPRVDLVHVPLGGEIDVLAAFRRLMDDGYLPVAIRPHATRPDEAVFQLTDDLDRPRHAIMEAQIADKDDRALVEAWVAAASVSL